MSDHDVGRAFGILHESFLGAVDGGHHFPPGIKGSLAHARQPRFHLLLFQTGVTGEIHQSAFGGLVCSSRSVSSADDL